MSSPFPASLSFVPSPCASDFLGPEKVPRMPRFLPAFVDLLQVHTRCLNRVSPLGSGEFSIETRRVRMWGVVLVSGCWWSEQVLLASVRLSLSCRRPRLESSTTESTTWIAATSSYDTWSIIIFLRGDGIASKYSESLALLRKDLLAIAHGKASSRWLPVGVSQCVCTHGWVFLRIPHFIQMTVEFM